MHSFVVCIFVNKIAELIRTGVDIKKLPEKLINSRIDLSPWLWHFVKREHAPDQTLRKIIHQKKIKGASHKPCRTPVICFTETPLFSHIKQDGDLKTFQYKRFSLYGVGFRRKKLYDLGARPVIYTERMNYDELPESLRYLFVEFNLDRNIDFTWQREWRLLGKEYCFDENDAILVFPDHNEFIDVIFDYWGDAEYDDGVLTAYGGRDKLWNFIPLDFCEAFDQKSIEAYLRDDFSDYDEYIDWREIL